MKLYPHQNEAITKALPILRQNLLVYLVMEVRTGKTLTSLSIAKEYLSGSENPTVGFITKKKAIPSIENDFKEGGFHRHFRLECVNYERIKDMPHCDLWIIDEAHACGQYPKPSIRTQLLKEKINGAPCILLSGTPTPESFSQIFHQLWITGNSPFVHKKFYDWAKDGFVNIKNKMIGGHKINDYSHANIPLIEKHINHLIVSCSQSDAGFENKVIETTIYVPMNDISKYLYAKLEKDQVVEYGGRTFVADTPANMINKFSQISGGTLIDDNGESLTFDDSKIQMINRLYSGKRLAIYYRYKAEFELLKNNFPKHTTDWTSFENGDSPVFLSQIQSGREGISLRSADLIIMYNIDFSATSYWQVRARMQYRDRKGACHIHWLFSDLGIEERVYKAVSQKKNFTISYYNKYVRIQSTKSSQKSPPKGWLDSGENKQLQSARMARSTGDEKWENGINRMQGSGQNTNTSTKIQTRNTSCSWL